MSNERKHHTPEEKVAILRRDLTFIMLDVRRLTDSGEPGECLASAAPGGPVGALEPQALEPVAAGLSRWPFHGWRHKPSAPRGRDSTAQASGLG
jgi:hypothetical protein